MPRPIRKSPLPTFPFPIYAQDHPLSMNCPKQKKSRAEEKKAKMFDGGVWNGGPLWQRVQKGAQMGLSVFNPPGLEVLADCANSAM